MSHHTKILAALMWVAPGYSGISPELKFVNLVVVRKASPRSKSTLSSERYRSYFKR
jgi:hypothetical protein